MVFIHSPFCIYSTELYRRKAIHPCVEIVVVPTVIFVEIPHPLIFDSGPNEAVMYRKAILSSISAQLLLDVYSWKRALQAWYFIQAWLTTSNSTFNRQAELGFGSFLLKSQFQSIVVYADFELTFLEVWR